MGNVVRLVNGGTVQVRTGVLAGVGPIGPRGPVGLQGIDGPQGPVGPEGRQGEILNRSSRALVGSTIQVAPNTPTNVAFSTTAYDDMGCFTTPANFTISQTSDYMISAWVRFAPGTAAGRRSLKIVSDTNGTLWATSSASTTEEQFMEICCSYRVTTANEVLHVVATSTDTATLSITAGTVVVGRTGSGPIGPAGPAGPEGPRGIQGIQGPKGDTGNAGSGYATYGQIDGG